MTGFLFGVVLKATLLLGVALLGLRGLRHGAPALRSALLAGALFGVLLLPLLSLLLPPLRAPLPLLTRVPVPERSVSSLDPGPLRTLPAILPLVAGPTGSPPAVVRRNFPSGPLLPAAWLAGVLSVLGWLVAGRLIMRRLVARSRPCRSPEWLEQTAALSRELGLRVTPPLQFSGEIPAPLTFGALHPVILLPPTAASWQADRRRAVLLHELAHVERRDCAVEYLASLACAVYWFHPAVWLVARRLRQERELACDALVIRRDVRPTEYAAHLVEIAAGASRPAVLGGLPLAHQGGLERRIRVLLAGGHPRASGRATSTSLAIAAPLLLGIVAAVQPSRAPVFRDGPATVDTLEFRIEPEQPVSWNGALAPGDTLSVRAAMGDISIDSSGSGAVEVRAVRRSGPRGHGSDTRVAIVRSPGSIAICSVHHYDGRRVAPCRINDDWGRGSVDDNEVSFHILVPPGVHLNLLTGLGDLRARRHHGDVQAVTGNGLAELETDGAANVEAYSGGISLKLLPGESRAPISMSGKHAFIELTLAPGTGTDLDARTALGRVVFREQSLVRGPERFVGRLGGGGRSVRAVVEKGDIRILTP